MTLSALDLFTIGIGPSSSHTVGPMRAARLFALDLLADRDAGGEPAQRITIDLYGSLGATGMGHGTDRALLIGLEGATPELVDPSDVERRVAQIKSSQHLRVGGRMQVPFDPPADVRLCPSQVLPGHPNGMIFTAYDTAGNVLHQRTLYSVGGGFVIDEGDVAADRLTSVDPPPWHFHDAAGLLSRCRAEGVTVAELVAMNEDSMRPREETAAALLAVWEVMQACVLAGCTTPGTLPGMLAVTRRAPRLYQALMASPTTPHAAPDSLVAVDWLTVDAIAVNEENAAGGRVVTAPTNGAAGIIPAVLHYYWRNIPSAHETGVVRFLLAAAAIGIIVKEHASISGAEVGCQGEVGSACAMAAAGLCEVLGGTPEQVENAAEIALEHNLGLTCDPVGGLVQIPCIERNAVGAVKAVTAVRLAMRGDGTHRVSFDQAVETLRATGADMSAKYKETSTGGLAVNVTEC
ncbi:MAG: L-serine ammonia-lyase [Ornithinimicrobium sp.]